MSDIETLRDLCNAAIEDEKAGNMRDSGQEWKLKYSLYADGVVYVPVARLGDYIVLKPKKDS